MSISPEEDAVHLSLHSLGIVPGLAQCLSLSHAVRALDMEQQELRRIRRRRLQCR